MAFDFKDLNAGALRQTIADAEAKESELYAALGKKLFCAGGDASQCAGEMAAVRALKESASLAEALLAEMEASKIVCASCGKLLRSGARFCSACGVPVTATKPAAEPEKAAEAEKAEVPAPVCPACGKTLRAGALFCNGCGAKV